MFSLAVCKGLYLLPLGATQVANYRVVGYVGEAPRILGYLWVSWGDPQVKYHQKLIGCLLDGVCEVLSGTHGSLMPSKSNWLLFSKAPHS